MQGLKDYVCLLWAPLNVLQQCPSLLVDGERGGPVVMSHMSLSGSQQGEESGRVSAVFPPPRRHPPRRSKASRWASGAQNTWWGCRYCGCVQANRVAAQPSECICLSALHTMPMAAATRLHVKPAPAVRSVQHTDLAAKGLIWSYPTHHGHQYSYTPPTMAINIELPHPPWLLIAHTDLDSRNRQHSDEHFSLSLCSATYY